MSTTEESLRALVKNISQKVELLTTTLTENTNGVTTYIDDASAIRGKLLDDVAELQLLIRGPAQTLAAQALGIYDVPVISVLLSYNVPRSVPQDSSIEFGKLSQKVGLDEDRLTRILYYAFTMSIFREDPPGHVAHTAISSYLSREENSGLIAVLQMNGDQSLRSAAYLRDALKTYPNTQLPTQTAFNLAFGTDKTYFDWIVDKGNEERLKQFITWQSVVARQIRPVEVTVQAFPWVELGANAKVVDIGGNKGHVSRALASAYPNLNLVVQDFAEIIAVGSQELQETEKRSIRERISFMEHNFFDTQPVIDADVYLFRHIFHDWPDVECIQLMKNVIPAMKPGARLLVADAVIPEREATVPKSIQRHFRQTDLQLMTMNNAKERTRSQFEALFETVDRNLVYKNYFSVNHVTGNLVFELCWQP